MFIITVNNKCKWRLANNTVQVFFVSCSNNPEYNTLVLYSVGQYHMSLERLYASSFTLHLVIVRTSHVLDYDVVVIHPFVLIVVLTLYANYHTQH